MASNGLTSHDLVRLAGQIERDRELGWQQLHRRDAEIGERCRRGNAVTRLQCWLDSVSFPDEASERRPLLGEVAIGLLLSGIFLVAGFLTMAGFLFAHGQGMVNLLWFFALFVLFQLLMCLLSGATLVSVLLGNRPASLSLNPARLLSGRALPDWRRWREFQDVVQLGFLRYGQGMGVGFISGALLAFVLVPLVNDFSFFWGSTFNLTDAAMQRFAEIVSAPWDDWLPVATVDAQVITDSRYHPSAGRPDPSQVESMHSWWPFLCAAMIAYALLPRLLLGWLSRHLYRRHLASAFVAFPGADQVLRRMKQPLIRTGGEAGSDQQPAGQEIPVEALALPPEGVLLVNWKGALAAGETGEVTGLHTLKAGDVAAAGLSLAADREALARVASESVQWVVVAVQSWEPPMADLADFIEEAGRHAACVLLLRPLRGDHVSADQLDDWRRFAGELPGGAQVAVMSKAPAGGTGESGGGG
jgi:hypothetical protein